MLRKIACAGLLAACTSPLQAQDAAANAAWRASSRLGYGPTAAISAEIAARGGAQAWALQQIDAAKRASGEPARIPPELTHFNQPIGAIFEAFREEREARKAAREKQPKKDAGAPATATPTMATPAPTHPTTTHPTTTTPTVATLASAAPGPAAMNDNMFSRDAARESAVWRIAACSRPDMENPLLARMTEFWFNHLNVFVGKGPVRPFAGHYVVNVIRPHAMGRFEDLLLASARHPAMLFYLDQAQSVADGSGGALGRTRGLNENYARELMELHTLGVNGGYTQGDVRELARILTGWTVGPLEPSGFRFAERLHDSGEKKLLGVTYQARGQAEGEEAIRMLARHPATARRIATRLATFFVSDQPAPALVDRLARSFSASGGDTRAILRTLVEAPEFWQADQKLFKTPFDYACSALTALGGAQDRRDFAQALGFLAGAGQPVHGWQTPDGYKTDAATWMAPEALTRRADFAVALGRQAAEPVHLNTYLSAATRTRIAQEPAPLRPGLMLASPDFMSK